MNKIISIFLPRRARLSDSWSALKGQAFTSLAPALALLLLTHWAATAGLVYETSAEFLTCGDFNGDGIADVLVLDRATGNARVGYRDGTNGLTWSAPLITGVTSPDGLTVGRFLQTNLEALAITSIELNRAHLLDLSNPSNAPAPTVVTPAGLGPNLLIGLAAPYGAPGRFDWLLVGNADAGQAGVELFGFLDGQLASSLDSAALPAPLVRGNALQLGADPMTFAAAIQRGTNDQFIVCAPSNHFSPLIIRSNLPPRSDYVFGQFNGEALPRFIFYVPGQSNLIVQALVPTNGGFVFDAGIPVSFAEAVQGVYYVSEGPADGCALVRFGDGVEGLRLPGGVANVSAVYRSGGGAAGNVFTGLVPLSNGNFVLLDGPPASGISAHAQVVRFDGTNYTQTSAGNLPPTTTRSTRANVWLFQAEPFVSDAPGFISSLNVPDWTDTIEGLPATLAVQTESDTGLPSGLGNATLHSLGSPPSSAGFALPDQYRDFISLFTYSSPRAPEAVTVAISPVAGLYGGRIVVSFIKLNVQDKVFYRLGTDPWRQFLVQFPLTNDVTVQYYGTNYFTSSRSRFLSASYSFGRSGGAPQAPLDLAPGSTNPAPVFNTNQFIVSEFGTVFYGRRSATNNGTIWAINLEGSGETYITAGARPRVSKDGRYLAFLRDGNPLVTQGNVWVRDLPAGQETLLFTNQNFVIGYDWDRTGTNLVFDFSCWLFRIGLSGPGSVLPLATDCFDDAPTVNPSDGRLAFQNLNPNGPPGLYVTTTDATAKQRLNLINVAGPSWPAWSPDGRWLAFADGNTADAAFTADGGMNLYVVQPDGTGLSQITRFTDGTNRFPHGAVWSPDGEALVGAGTIFGTNGLWVIPLTPDYSECDCPPILLPTAPGEAIDFVGSVVVAPAPPQTVVRPGLFIRLEPDAAVVYWSAIFADFTLESTTGLSPSATWTSINGPHDFDGYFYQYREPLAALQQTQLFRLRKAPPWP